MTVLQYKLQAEVGICADGEQAKVFWFSEGENESVVIHQ